MQMSYDVDWRDKFALHVTYDVHRRSRGHRNHFVLPLISIKFLDRDCVYVSAKIMQMR